MASVLDSVAPPSAQLVGESIRVHDDFFGDVNVKLLSFCPDLTSLASRCFYLPHTYLPHRARQSLSIRASAILRSGQTLVSLCESKEQIEPSNLRIGKKKARSVIFLSDDLSRDIRQITIRPVFAKFIGAIISGRA
jgi:hypothetical protein